MPPLLELLRQGRYDEIWRQYCGFLDLSLEDFMKVQERLLLEQLDLVNRSEWGKIFLLGRAPTTLEEFRRIAPLTTYEDYNPYLEERREDVLPRKPQLWAHTSGRSGRFKWVPYTPEMYAGAGARIMTCVILSMAQRRRDVRLKEQDVFLYNTPARPYTSGVAMTGLAELFPFCFVPPLDQTESMTFQERLKTSFEMALTTGIDVMGAITSVLIKMGERFAQGGGTRPPRRALTPKALYRLGRALLRSRLAKRPVLPRDLWTVKGVICGGTDTTLHKDLIAYYWGVTPYEMYAFTEAACTIACQAWNREGLYFCPDAAFVEFIPEEEWIRNREDESYTPRTVLLNEVKLGQRYELVMTSLAGGPFIRYRIGDLVRFVTLRNEKEGIALPSMIVAGRDDGLIDLAGFTGLIDEPMIWRAIHDTGIAYEEWTVRKESRPSGAFLHLYIELTEDVPSEEVRQRVHDNLKTLNPFYADLETMLEVRALEVTLLPKGAFQAYTLRQQAAGADLSHMKPPHMNAPEIVIQDLLRMDPQVS